MKSLKIDSVKRGNEFEEKASQIIENAINNGDLLIVPSSYRIFKKKGYYSRDREKEIIFDLSLEIWAPKADRFQMLYIVECKSYFPNTIPVNDIEEFHSKINQVAGVNVKGILITDTTLQEGTFNFAKSKGIMVIQVHADNNYSIILHKIQKNDIFNSAINPYNNFSETKELENKIETFFSELFLSSDEKIIGLNYYSRNEIEKITENIILDFSPNLLKRYGSIDTNQFINYIKDNYDITTKSIPRFEFENGKQILGYFDNQNKTIYIDQSLTKEKGKYRFILFHEFGHFILHSKLKINQSIYNSFKDSEYNMLLNRYELTNVKHWIEWQANQFSSSILMPKENIKALLLFTRHEIGIKRHLEKIYLDDQPVNIKDFITIIRKLSTYYNVSYSAVIYRLNTLGLINDQRKKMKFLNVLKFFGHMPQL